MGFRERFWPDFLFRLRVGLGVGTAVAAFGACAVSASALSGESELSVALSLWLGTLLWYLAYSSMPAVFTDETRFSFFRAVALSIGAFAAYVLIPVALTSGLSL